MLEESLKGLLIRMGTRIKRKRLKRPDRETAISYFVYRRIFSLFSWSFHPSTKSLFTRSSLASFGSNSFRSFSIFFGSFLVTSSGLLVWELPFVELVRPVEVPEESKKLRAISRPFAIAIRAARLYTAGRRYRSIVVVGQGVFLPTIPICLLYSALRQKQARRGAKSWAERRRVSTDRARLIRRGPTTRVLRQRP